MLAANENTGLKKKTYLKIADKITALTHRFTVRPVALSRATARMPALSKFKTPCNESTLFLI
jgi:hypothetical protein